MTNDEIIEVLTEVLIPLEVMSITMMDSPYLHPCLKWQIGQSTQLGRATLDQFLKQKQANLLNINNAERISLFDPEGDRR